MPQACDTISKVQQDFLKKDKRTENVTHLVCDCVEISADDARTNCHDEIDGRIATPRETSFTVDDAVSCRGILGDENVNVARTSKTYKYHG